MDYRPGSRRQGAEAAAPAGNAPDRAIPRLPVHVRPMALKFADEMLRGVTSIYRTRKESDNNPGLALPQPRCDLASNSMPCSAKQQSLGIEQVSASGNRRLSECLRLKVPKATRSSERREDLVLHVRMQIAL